MASNTHFLLDKVFRCQPDQYFVVNRWTGNLSLINKPGFFGRFFYPLIYSSDVKRIWNVVEQALQQIHKTQSQTPLQQHIIRLIRENVQNILDWGETEENNWNSGPQRQAHDKVVSMMQAHFPVRPDPVQPAAAPAQPAPTVARPAPAIRQPALTGPHFYSGRVGFTNTRDSCSHISLATAYAHTGLVDKLLSAGFPENHVENSYQIAQIDKRIADCERALGFRSKSVSELETPLQELEEKLAKETALKKNRNALLTPTINEKARERLLAVIEKGDLEIRKLEGEIKKITYQLNDEKRGLDELTAEVVNLKTNRPLIIESTKQTNQRNLNRARELLQILRTKTSFTLKEDDARIFCGVVRQLAGQDIEIILVGGEAYDVFPGMNPFSKLTATLGKAPTEEQLRPVLEAALADPNWRVIRVGGGRHWWAYVRNSDGETVTEINNSSTSTIHPTSHIVDRWSKPDYWRQTQITFYSVAN